uniref:Uncharacterized protein n=1 Tax=Pyxicephalus adspersus TaxID=30357 RepID=A0AAV3A7F6_PYXAD|nr:TPA: hypothetical protein GDO54_017689 [Pyxicephalus adspersus]
MTIHLKNGRQFIQDQTLQYITGYKHSIRLRMYRGVLNLSLQYGCFFRSTGKSKKNQGWILTVVLLLHSTCTLVSCSVINS